MYEEILARVPLFYDMSRRELTWLGDACRERIYAPGQTIIRQGGGSVGLVLIIEGTIHIARLRNDGTADEVGQLLAGAILGEQALLEETFSTETVTANEPTRALVLPIWDFLPHDAARLP